MFSRLHWVRGLFTLDRDTGIAILIRPDRFIIATTIRDYRVFESLSRGALDQLFMWLLPRKLIKAVHVKFDFLGGETVFPFIHCVTTRLSMTYQCTLQHVMITRPAMVGFDHKLETVIQPLRQYSQSLRKKLMTLAVAIRLTIYVKVCCWCESYSLLDQEKFQRDSPISARQASQVNMPCLMHMYSLFMGAVVNFCWRRPAAPHCVVEFWTTSVEQTAHISIANTS